MTIGADAKKKTATCRWIGWTRIFGVLMTMLFLGLAARLAQLQIMEHRESAVGTARQVFGAVRERDRRGLVIDARGRTLAMSVDSKACALDPHVLLEAPGAKPERVVARLGEMLALGENDVKRIEKTLGKKINADGKPIRFVWVKRRISEEEWKNLDAAMSESRKKASEAWRYRRRWQKRAGEYLARRDQEGERKAREAADGWKRAAEEQEGLFAGVFFPEDYQRVYPQGGLAAHILGFSNIDGDGLEGVEKLLNPFLQGRTIERMVARDARSRALSTLTRDDRSVDGMTVQLTIDSVIQSIVEEELYQVVARMKGEFPDITANAVIMEPFTGEILAIANYPTFDANHPGRYDPRNRRNDAVASIQEPGSTFKPLLFAASIDEGLADFNDDWDCSTYRMANGRVIKDLYPYGKMSLLMGLVKSSNPAMVRLGERLGPARMRQYVIKYGFGEKTGSLLPGEVRGRVTTADKWSTYTMGSVPMGYEINVTTLQMAAAYSVIANGGMLPLPTIVKAVLDERGDVALKVKPRMRRRVISEKTAGRMREALRKVVAEGTGRRANIEEYALGGKTGTASMVANEKERAAGLRGYSKKRNTANFIALAPWDKPRAVICVTIRETGKFGGEASSPVVAGIARRILAYWGVPTQNGVRTENLYRPPQTAPKPEAQYVIGAEDDENRLTEEVDPRLWEEWTEDESALG
ncbi:MAG: penicillin-binding protein 2 [Planctomycetota bacterium]|jgi:cell division protein FtsI/penicillin-binding protein 2|nr:penicillin-binding protein 2 [Planctomycetota bacterium]